MSSPVHIEAAVYGSMSERTRAHIRSSDSDQTSHSTSSSSNAAYMMPKPNTVFKPISSTSVSAAAAKSKNATRISASRQQPTSKTSVQQTPTTRANLSQTPSSHRHKNTEFPRLVQGSTTSLKAYHTSASIAFATLALDKNGEIEFVARFIKGMQTAFNRNLLLKQLEKTNPSITESGEQRVLCQWDDVAEALRSTGLIEPGVVVEVLPAKKKRRVLIPPEMIVDGMVR